MKRILIATTSVLTLFAMSLGAWAAPAAQGSSCAGNSASSGTCIVSPQSGCGYGTGADLSALLENFKSSGCGGGTNAVQVQRYGASQEGASGSCGSRSGCTSNSTCTSKSSCVSGSACTLYNDCASGNACQTPAASADTTASAADETTAAPAVSAADETAAPASTESTAPTDCGGAACTAGSNCAQSNCSTDAAQCETSTCTTGTNTTSVRSLLDYFVSLLEKCGLKTDIFCQYQPVPSAPAAQQDNGGTQTETPAPADSDTGTSAPADESAQAPASPDEADSLTFEEQVAALVNEQRAANGLAPLTFSTALSDVARAKSQDMHDKGYFDHTSPTYGTPFQMLDTFGISYRSAGENIAAGYATPEAVVTAWMNSPGHRANILNASYTQIGVGYVASGNYWTQLFIG